MTDDTMATSRAIDALKDPAAQAFADALVDRVSAIVGNHQLRVVDALAQLEAKQDGFNHPLGALVAKQDLITDHLDRQDKQLEAVSTGQSVLRADFQANAESLDERLSGLDTWRADVDADRQSFKESRDHSIAERQELQARDRAMVAQLDAILARLTELEDGINGRMTQFIKSAESAARAEGREEGRANPGGG